jgi:type II secretion system protein N
VSEARSAAGSPIPRSLLVLGVPIAGVLLTAFFFFLGFPWDGLRDVVATQASLATGARVTIDELGPGFSPLGPALAARGVSVTLPDGTHIQLDRARLRPAWSPAWFSGSPALAVDLEAPQGRMKGTLYAGSEPGFDGRLERVALASLPLDSVAPDLALDGTGEADVDVRSGEDGPAGSIVLHVADGSIGLPGLPIALPFETFDGTGELGGDARLVVQKLSLIGPMLSVEGSGQVGRSPALDSAPLEGKLAIDVREQSVRPMVRQLGVRLDRDGKAEVQLGGTVGRPDLGGGSQPSTRRGAGRRGPGPERPRQDRGGRPGER